MRLSHAKFPFFGIKATTKSKGKKSGDLQPEQSEIEKDQGEGQRIASNFKVYASFFPCPSRESTGTFL
jgi:flagellum-specific peptidoglycan hydrolase FlgJ